MSVDFRSVENIIQHDKFQFTNINHFLNPDNINGLTMPKCHSSCITPVLIVLSEVFQKKFYYKNSIGKKAKRFPVEVKLKVSIYHNSSRCDNQEPIKGILKRPSLKYEDRNQITHRPSPDHFPDEPATRIPKLSVTWWEKNAGMYLIVRSVVAVTVKATQPEPEISDLKSELRTALKERDEKEKHLEELRERIKEVELLNIRQASLSDSHRLMMRERKAAETFEREKKQIERRHAIRVNQLIHETLAARRFIGVLRSHIFREEVLRLTTRVKELEKVVNVPRVDSETMTDAVQFVPFVSQSPLTVDPVDPNQQNSESVLSPPPPPTTTTATTATATSTSVSLMTSSQVCGLPEQACQNEAFIWRTKAAQLEIVVKDQLAKASRIEEALRAELSAARTEHLPSTTPSLFVTSSQGQVSTKSIGIGADIITSTPARVSPVSFECTIPSCIERKKSLIQENDRLLGQSEKDTMQKAIAYMEERMQVYQNTLMENDLVVSDENSADWHRGFVDPRYNVMVSKRIQTTLTSEALSQHEDEFALAKEKLAELNAEFTSNRSNLHERFEEIEKILFTKTQVVDTLSRQLEETCRDQRQQIDAHQEERESYKKKLEEISSVAEKVPVLETRVEQLLKASHSTMSSCSFFLEIVQIALQKEKSELGIRFSAQRDEMEHALEDALTEALGKYKEQDEYWKSNHADLKQSLERAKAEIAQHVKEKEDMKIKAKLERADLENRLTSSIEHVAMLVNQMNKTRRDVECEARPRNVSKYVACRPNTRSKSTVITKGDLFDENEERLKLCQGELATTRRQVHVLQQKLISSLQDKAEKRLEVRRHIGNIVDPGSEPQKVDRGKLEAFRAKNDELCGQVATTEEEKEVLVRDERERIRHLVSEFENVHRELDQEMNRRESEKTWLRTRIRNLEIDNEELQRKIEIRDEQSGSTIKDSFLTTYDDLEMRKKPFHQLHLRKAVSEPDMCIDNNEASHFAENIQLRREVDRDHSSLRNTAPIIDRSHISPEFATLANDLNLVKSDLEKILSSMDHATTNDTTSDRIGHSSPSPIHSERSVDEEEILNSDILDTVMIDWEADEKKRLICDVYRREGVTMVRSAIVPPCMPGIIRSSSASDLTHNVINKDEIRVWKEKCGTMFRELNSIRSGYQQAQNERRELKIQLAMLRGELEIERCHRETESQNSMSSRENPLPLDYRSTQAKIAKKRRRTRSEQQKGRRRSTKTIILHPQRRCVQSGNAIKSLMSQLDIDQFDQLEQEEESFQLKESSSAEHALSEMRAQLELIRNENAMYEKKLRDVEEERREMYLVMFKKGQQAAAMDMKEVAEVDQMTQDRVVLRFLHDAFYYYLMDKGNAKEHLQAIMAMLDFSMEQKDEVIKKKSKSH
ncbi:unnamed protein product [Angiostrongylus costaricensis]|uniref:CFAP91 domain-containing protein n=1 Tax=Angiostrongylus costaricensis TaxID=334426 RepID=A0A0R3PAN9_ANGCS|nr:unnamed protein product [Angiostrongylus costaricensis]